MPKNRTFTRTFSHSNRRSAAKTGFRQNLQHSCRLRLSPCHRPILWSGCSTAWKPLNASSAPRTPPLPKSSPRLDRRRFPDARSLIRFHEALLFFRAYPPNARILRLTDRLLASFPDRIALLRRTGADLEPFEQPDVSGISGTGLSAVFTYDIARWLARHHPDDVDIDWEGSDADPSWAAAGSAPSLFRRRRPGGGEHSLSRLVSRRQRLKLKTSDLRWLISRLDKVPTPQRRHLRSLRARRARPPMGPRQHTVHSHQSAAAGRAPILLSHRPTASAAPMCRWMPN